MKIATGKDTLLLEDSQGISLAAALQRMESLQFFKGDKKTFASPLQNNMISGRHIINNDGIIYTLTFDKEKLTCSSL